MKRLTAMLLVIALFVLSCSPAYAAVIPGVSPQYENASRIKTYLTINADGNATVRVYCSAYSTTTRIHVSSYIEKQYGTTWVRINNGQQGWAWVTTVNGSYLNEYYTMKINESGTYRVVSTFLLTAAESETVTLIEEMTF